MARPKLAPDERRTEVAKASLSPREKADFLAQCETAGLTESEFLRRRILGYQVPHKTASQVDASLLYELNRIGVNVNQLAFAVHTDREFARYWREIGDELTAVLEKVAAKL